MFLTREQRIIKIILQLVFTTRWNTGRSFRVCLFKPVDFGRLFQSKRQEGFLDAFKERKKLDERLNFGENFNDTKIKISALLYLRL